MIDQLRTYLNFPFVQYALIVGVLIALCSSLLGVTLVLKRFSFIGDGLSHVAFGAMAIAGVLHLTNDMLGGGLSAAQSLLHICKSIRGCLYYVVWLNLYPDADAG